MSKPLFELTADWWLEEKRKCITCGEVKSLDDYHYRKADILKRQRRCKKCNQSKKPLGLYSKKVA